MEVVPDYREAKAEEEQGKASTEEGGLQGLKTDGRGGWNLEAEYDPITACGSRSLRLCSLGAAFASFEYVRFFFARFDSTSFIRSISKTRLSEP